MNANDIEFYLSVVGDELKELGVEKIRLLIIGGAYMLTQQGNRTYTGDVDGKILDINDPQNDETYLYFKNAIHFVSSDYKINDDWFSDTISDFLSIAGPLPRHKIWKQFGPLDILIPAEEGYILAHKLVAGRDKDDNDIRFLCKKLHINTRNQATEIVHRYITNDSVIDDIHFDLTLNNYFNK